MTILLTIEQTPQGYEPVGVVNSCAILATNVGKDIMAAIRNMVGGRCISYEKVLKDLTNLALENLKNEAEKQGMDLVVGVRMTQANLTPNGLGEIIAYGTGCRKIQPLQQDAIKLLAKVESYESLPA